MEDFEQKLKQLKLAEPSVNLKKKIFENSGGKTVSVTVRTVRKTKSPSHIFSTRIHIAWAAILALFMGIAGFYVARFFNDKASSNTGDKQSSVKLQIIYNNEGNKNVFDFTETQNQTEDNTVKINVKPGKEV